MLDLHAAKLVYMLMPNTVFSDRKHVTQTSMHPNKHEAVMSTRKNLSSAASTPMPFTLSPTQVMTCTLQVVDSNGNTEALALSAVEQLMDEET